MKNLSFLFLLGLLSGCGQPYWQQSYDERRNAEVIRLGEEAKQRDTNPNKFAYTDGQKDGCSSGNNATGNYVYTFKKDVDRYIGNQYYKSGWDDGFAQCKGQGELINDVITNTLR